MIADQRFSGYEILGTKEETRGAIVYRGVKAGTNEPVLIQELKINAPSPAEMAVFSQEFKSIDGKMFPGIVHYIDRIETRDTVALVVVDCNAVPLGEMVTEIQGDLARFLDVSVNILDVLSNLHRKNIIHKNITPRSIMIKPGDGGVKLTHFGFITDLTHENEMLHDPEVIRNTLVYMAPEQTAHMNRPVDSRTDLYSLGVVFYEMLTGFPPFYMDNPLEMIHAHIARLPIAPDTIRPNVPHVVSGIVQKLLAKNPEDRYQSAEGVMADLIRCRERLTDSWTVESFPLGTQDRSLTFTFPQVLIGRESEVTVLMDSFSRVTYGVKSLVSVGGLPGIGKSALINEIRKPVVAHKGYFSSGKFDQFTRDIPYSAIIQSFKGLIHQILAEGDRKIAEWKKRIRAALGPNGRVITDEIPVLELLIGPQPEIPQLDPEESKNRFYYVFQNFLNCFAFQEHSLVIFLDDMQWADAASTELIKIMITHHSTRNFLLICAYRSNEINPAHPYMLAVKDILNTGVPVHELVLGPIDTEQANGLVAIALRCNKEDTQDLSGLIHQKTGGNPFFILQFCKSLYDQGYFSPDTVKGLSWDLDRIKQMQVTDNVVELMAGQISALPEKTRNALTFCAAMGNQFSLETLAMVSGLSLEQAIEDLSDALKSQFLDLHNGIYRFQHDRIQEAAYSLIPEEKRAEIHYSIGRNILEKTSARDFAESVFQIADHLNQGMSLIRDPDEKIRLAELNLSAGDKARKSTAYRSAIAYLDHAVQLLPVDHWESHYDMSLSIHMKLLECQSLGLDLDAALTTFDSIVMNIRGNTDIANAYNLMTYLYTIHGDFEKALRLGIKGMSIVGVKIPEKVSNLMILWQLIRTRFRFGRLRIEEIQNLPNMTDPEVIAYTYLAVSTTTVAYYVDANLFTYIVMNGAGIIPRYGNCEITPFALNAIGSILCSIGFFEQGFRFGETSLKMIDRFTHFPQRGRVLYLFSFFILHTRRHAKQCIENFRKSFTLCLEAGDLIFSLHSISMREIYRVMLGDNLSDILSEYTHYENFQKEGQDPFTWQMYRDTLQLCRCLQGVTDMPGRMDERDYSEEGALSYYRSEDNLIGVFFVRLNQLKIRYLFGEYNECQSYFPELRSLLKSKIAIGAMHIPEFVLYHSLVIAAVYQDASVIDRIRYYAQLAANLARMKRWARNCPDNYLHKYHMIRAEMYRLRKKKTRAVRAYRDAAQSAGEFGYTQNRAIVYERLSSYHVEFGDMDLAAYYMKEACMDFNRVGYVAKVIHLRKSNPHMLKDVKGCSHQDTKNTLAMIDLDTVMQISRAISGEIVLDRLLRLIMDITMKRAGASRGFLLLENNGQLIVEAESNLTETEEFRLTSIPLDNHDGLARSVVHYVARTLKPLILDNAAIMGDFTLDPYILDRQPGSILCFPILNQGHLSAVIYFENMLTASAFKTDHVELLGLLAAQAAVAIDNARLYENLEEKVSQRTTELNSMLKTVENANLQIMESLKYAAVIQQSLLPDHETIRSKIPDFFFIWMPRDIVGGDLYHFETIDDCFILAVIDCTGHGVPGAFMTMIASSGLRRIIREEKEINPARILAKLSAFVKTTLQQDTNNAHSDDGLDAAICCYKPETDTLEFAGARLPLFVARDGILRQIKGDRESLGYISTRAVKDFTLHAIQPASGNHFYMVTDGFSDQLGVKDSERFGNQRFRDLIAEHHQKPFSEQKIMLTNALSLHKGEADQTDDITIVGFRI